MAATAGTAANQERPKGRLADRRHAPASDPPAAPCFTSSNHGRRRPRRSIGADPVIRGSASQPGLISRSALPLRTSTGHAGCPSASPPVAAPLDDRDQSQGRPQDARTRGEGRGRLGRRRTHAPGRSDRAVRCTLTSAFVATRSLERRRPTRQSPRALGADLVAASRGEQSPRGRVLRRP
jgi:hypothetical protein